MKLVDSHCHLDFPDFAPDLADLLARARRAGVVRMVTIGTTVSRFAETLVVAEAEPDVFCTVGVHPHEAATETVDAGFLTEAATHPKVVGIGECGLDYFYDLSPRETQQAVFRTHLTAARECGLPVVVHTRDAEADTVAILAEVLADGPIKGVIHCFSGTSYLAEKALEFGFYLSFSGIATFGRADDIRAVARDMPLERMLVETDAPYLAPVPKRGKRNEPAFVALTAARLAEVRGMTPDALADATTANFLRLFDKVTVPE